MRRVISRIHQGLAWLVLAGVLLQFYLAGMVLFVGTSFELHRTLGYLLAVPVIFLLVLALAGRLGRLLIGLSALLLLLTIVQIMLPSLRGDASWIAALHPVNALSLLIISAAIGSYGRAEVKEAS